MDARQRRLERRAARGDREALASLVRLHARQGEWLPGIQEMLREIGEAGDHGETAHTSLVNYFWIGPHHTISASAGANLGYDRLHMTDLMETVWGVLDDPPDSGAYRAFQSLAASMGSFIDEFKDHARRYKQTHRRWRRENKRQADSLLTWLAALSRGSRFFRDVAAAYKVAFGD
jgi:hypothetical protein